uniref:Protein DETOXIFICATION n=1 Tax=Oryza meridionalis TaxID=40149 RepID=A0A0E0EWT8_9ORYZ
MTVKKKNRWPPQEIRTLPGRRWRKRERHNWIIRSDSTLEWSSFEILVLLSGILPNPQLETAVLSISLSTASLLIMVPRGIGSSLSTRVSNELGGGHPRAARMAARVATAMTVLVCLVLVIAMILLRDVWGYAYSSEEEVVAYIASMLPILAVSFFVDGINGALSGVLTGCGKQKIGAHVNLGAFYLVGIPTAVLLAFVLHLNGEGLWLGIVCGSISKVGMLLFITLHTDWGKEVQKASPCKHFGYHGERKGLRFKYSNSMKNSRNVGVIFSNEDVLNAHQPKKRLTVGDSIDMDDPTVEEPMLAVRRGGDGEDEAMASTAAAAAAEVKRLLRLAGPLMASFVLRNSVQMVSVMFVGHLGELQLAGSSLAASLANVTGFSFLFGMSSALDTLCGQAYGAGQHRLLGVYAQRAMLVLAAAAVPIALVWASAGEILLLFGQDPAIAAEAGVYARWMIPSLAAYVPLACALRFLQAQGIVVPVMVSSGVAAVGHVAVCWALVHKVGMGSKGAALSGAVTYWTNLAVLAFYARLSGACKTTWTGFSVDAFRELRRFTELAVPSAMMVCLEWWSFEILVLLSGILPNPQLETSVLSICLSTSSLLFMVPRGIGSSLSTRVSNELGGGHPRAARMAARVAIAMTVLVCLVLVIAMIFLCNVWGYAYSSEEEVVAYIASMLPVLAVSFFVDGINGALSGVLTGCGKQKIGAHVNLGAFYLVGIPMAVLLAFVLHLNGEGLWLGLVCGSISKVGMLLFITLRTDWGKEAIMAKERVFSSSLPT